METQLYFITYIGFIALTILFYGLVLKTLKGALSKTSFSQDQQKRIFNKVLIAFLIWLIATSALSFSGILSDFNSFPPKIGIVLLIPLVTILWITFSKTAAEILNHIPPRYLIRLQSFRFFVEILLWMLFIRNLAPVQMTFEGRNFDILSGITAPIIAYLFAGKKISKTIVIAWNIVCLGLLINIVSVAILSMPTPFRYFMNEPANTIVTKFPVVLLPAFLVPLAYGLHFFSLKQLLKK